MDSSLTQSLTLSTKLITIVLLRKYLKWPTSFIKNCFFISFLIVCCIFDILEHCDIIDDEALLLLASSMETLGIFVTFLSSMHSISSICLKKIHN